MFIVPDVQAALVTLLAARAGLAGVQVSDGYSGDDETQAETIFTGDARSVGELVAGLKAGRTYYQETAEVDVVILVKVPGGSPRDAKARAQVLCKEVAACVADNRTLGGVVGLNWAVATSWDLRTAYGDAGAIAELTYIIRYVARLT